MNNLASLLVNQDKHDDAERLYRKTLDLREKVLGPNHPHTLIVKDNLAALLRSHEDEGSDLSSSDNDSWETISETNTDKDDD
jgi:hypothetical protein